MGLAKIRRFVFSIFHDGGLLKREQKCRIVQPSNPSLSLHKHGRFVSCTWLNRTHMGHSNNRVEPNRYNEKFGFDLKFGSKLIEFYFISLNSVRNKNQITRSRSIKFVYLIFDLIFMFEFELDFSFFLYK